MTWRKKITTEVTEKKESYAQLSNYVFLPDLSDPAIGECCFPAALVQETDGYIYFHQKIKYLII